MWIFIFCNFSKQNVVKTRLPYYEGCIIYTFFMIIVSCHTNHKIFKAQKFTVAHEAVLCLL